MQVSERPTKEETLTDFVKRCSAKILTTFIYKHDGLLEFGDTIPPPPEAYFQMKHGELKDDCDGFHSCLFHMVRNYAADCKLLEIFSLHNTFGHCVLQYNDFICDYDRIMNIDEAKDYYNDLCEGEFIVFGVDYTTKFINLGEIKW